MLKITYFDIGETYKRKKRGRREWGERKDGEITN
jgi:hypothetical protein